MTRSPTRCRRSCTGPGTPRSGLDWEYDAVRVPEDGLADFVAGLDAALARAVADDAAQAPGARAGAAPSPTGRGWPARPTRWCSSDGAVVLADNTDLPGAAAAVRERYDGPVRAATVLGGGATAASTGLALCDLGARAVRLLARDARPGRRDGRRDRGASVGARASRSAPWPTAASRATSWSSTIPAAAQDAALVARCADVPGGLRGGLRPVADAARRGRGRPGAGLGPRPAGAPGGRCSSSCSPACPRRWPRCGPPARPSSRPGTRPPVSVDVAGGRARRAAVRCRRGCAVPGADRAHPRAGAARTGEDGRAARYAAGRRAARARRSRAAVAAAIAGALVGGAVGLDWPLLFLLPLVPVGGRAGRRRPAHPPAADRGHLADPRRRRSCWRPWRALARATTRARSSGPRSAARWSSRSSTCCGGSTPRAWGTATSGSPRSLGFALGYLGWAELADRHVRRLPASSPCSASSRARWCGATGRRCGRRCPFGPFLLGGCARRASSLGLGRSGAISSSG